MRKLYKPILFFKNNGRIKRSTMPDLSQEIFDFV